MKVYIIADIEGMAGVVFYCNNKGSHLAHDLEMRNRLLMTEEVNAAVRGALTAGADEIVVHDHHGVGYNIMPELLHEKAELIHGRNEQRVALETLHPDLDGSFNAVLLLGMHPKAGTLAGGTPHSLIYVKNDQGQEYFLGEATNSAAFAGSFGVPAVMVAGDLAVCEDTALHIPGIETVVTKKHFASQLARTKAPVLSRKLIETGVAKALHRLGEIKPLVIPGKCTVQISDRNPAKKWPVAPREYPDFRTAMLNTIKDVPWYKPVTAIDDGWRYPDAQQPGSVVSEWN
jgi:D-amino peptidase